MHHSSTGSKPGMGMSLKDVIELGAERRGVRAERMSKSLRNRLLTDAVLQSSIAETVISIIIMLNIIVIGLSADIALDWGGWVVVDALFAAVFLLESIVKLRLVGLCTFFLGPDRCWNLFEAVLAWLAVMEVALNLMSNKSGDDSRFSLLRIFRLLRITRVVRVCRIPAFADLMMMINGAIGGTRTLLWSVVLISVPLYAVALFFRETLGAYSDQGQGAEVFRSLPWSFFVVFSCVVSSECNTEDGVPLMLSVIKHYGWHFGLIYCVTMLLMTFGLFNVIMAIYVENTVAAAKYNDVGLKRQRLRDQQLVAEKLHELLELTCNIWYTKQDRKRVSGSSGGDSKTAETVLSVDVWNAMGPNGDLYKSTLQDSLGLEITPAFLEELRGDSRFNSLLRDLDISDENTMDLFETLDADGGGTIDVEELITGIVKLRGDARRSDIVAVSLVVRNLHKLVASLEERSEQMHEELRAMRNAAGVSSRNGLTSSYSGSLAGSSRAPTVADRGSVQSNFRQLEI